MAYWRIMSAVGALLFGMTASATTLFPQQFTCPVGGAKFEAMVIGSHTSWGQRPDGRRYGTSPVIPLTECPDNGFVFFKEKFSDAEAERLAPLVLGAEYQAMRQAEAPHYRGWWLMSRTEQDPFDTAWMLQVASWESDDQPARKARYQAAFAEAARSLVWSEDKRDAWFWTNLRAANALRELGRFDESELVLDGLDSQGRLPVDGDELKGARYLIDGLRLLNRERNPASEPANLIPTRMAAYRCLEDDPALSQSEIAVCQSDDVKKAMEEVRKYRQGRD